MDEYLFISQYNGWEMDLAQKKFYLELQDIKEGMNTVQKKSQDDPADWR